MSPITGWELAELRAGSVPAPPAPAAFDRTGSAAPRSTVFEVSPTSGVPEELLAPARAAAQAAGYAAGWASGIRAARVIADAETHMAATKREHAAAAHADKVDQAVAAVHHAATALEQRAVPDAQHIEELIISSALAIAEALVGQVLRDDAFRSQAALARALDLAPVDENVTVALSPADYLTLGADTLVPQGVSRSIAFVEDASLAPGDAFASCGATTVDARLSSGLDRVREVLAR